MATPRKPGPPRLYVRTCRDIGWEDISRTHWEMLPSRPPQIGPLRTSARRGCRGWWRPLPCGGWTMQGLTADQRKRRRA